MTVPEHNALIASAAKAALRPIGCFQKGKSRTWLDDHGWWVGVIEFQPSSLAKGTFLNVGACWLWSGKTYLSFDEGYRIEPLYEFKNSEQFENDARIVADRAQIEVARLRDLFSTFEKTANYLKLKSIDSTDIWAHFHAGVSAGLMGWISDANQCFTRALLSDSRDIDWVRELKSRCEELIVTVESTQAFRLKVAEHVAQARDALKLPLLKGPTFDL